MLRVQRNRSREEGPPGEASDRGRSQEEFARRPHVKVAFSLQRSTSYAMYQKQHINGAARSIRIELSNEEEDRALKDLWE